MRCDNCGAEERRDLAADPRSPSRRMGRWVRPIWCLSHPALRGLWTHMRRTRKLSLERTYGWEVLRIPNVSIRFYLYDQGHVPLFLDRGFLHTLKERSKYDLENFLRAKTFFLLPMEFLLEGYLLSRIYSSDVPREMWLYINVSRDRRLLRLLSYSRIFFLHSIHPLDRFKDFLLWELNKTLNTFSILLSITSVRCTSVKQRTSLI